MTRWRRGISGSIVTDCPFKNVQDCRVCDNGGHAAYGGHVICERIDDDTADLVIRSVNLVADLWAAFSVPGNMVRFGIPTPFHPKQYPPRPVQIITACGHPPECEGMAGSGGDEAGCGWCADLADLKMLTDHLSRIYDYCTHGRISKPNTKPEEVIAIAGDLETVALEQAGTERAVLVLENLALEFEKAVHPHEWAQILVSALARALRNRDEAAGP